MPHKWKNISKKVLNLERKGLESRYGIGTSLTQQTVTKGTKRSEIFSYRFGFFEFYFCLHYVLGDKACPLPDKREMSLKEFEKTG